MPLNFLNQKPGCRLADVQPSLSVFTINAPSPAGARPGTGIGQAPDLNFTFPKYKINMLYNNIFVSSFSMRTHGAKFFTFRKYTGVGKKHHDFIN